MGLRCFIVDDEPFVRADIRQLLAAHADVEVVAEAGSRDECEQALTSKQIDLVFLDIQLRGCDGFDIVPMVRLDTEIIFVTAFDQYAVRAFEVNAVDYLLKPLQPARLRLALERVRERLGAPVATTEGRELDRTDRVLLRTDSERRFVAVRRIASVTSLGGNYSELQFADCAERPAVRQTLKEWERVLPRPMFLRVHRNAIVNIQAIERIERDEDGGCLVWAKGGGIPLIVSRRALADFNRAVDDCLKRVRL